MTMIDFMLNDLGCPTCIGSMLLFEVLIQIVHFDFFVSCTGSHTIQGQASFFCLKCLFLFGDLTPIIFAAIPTHRSRFARSVSRRSCTTCLSASVAGRDFCARNKGSLTIAFTISFSPFSTPDCYHCNIIPYTGKDYRISPTAFPIITLYFSRFSQPSQPALQT